MMNPQITKTNVKAFKVLSDNKTSFSQQLEASRALKDWKASPETKSKWLSQKRKSLTTALTEFRDLYGAREYYARFGKNDDSFEIFYRT